MDLSSPSVPVAPPPPNIAQLPSSSQALGMLYATSMFIWVSSEMDIHTIKS